MFPIQTQNNGTVTGDVNLVAVPNADDEQVPGPAFPNTVCLIDHTIIMASMTA